MYCVKCGVELKDSEPVCPLCGTRVYHPDIVREEGVLTYPAAKDEEVKVSSRGIMFAVTAAFLAIIAQLIICRISIPASSSWVGYAIGGVTLFYIIVFMPIWFHRPNPVIFVPCNYAAILLFLLYVDLSVHGGWFLGFCLPIVGTHALIVTAVVTLVYYVRRGYLYIFGGALIAHGLFMVLLELLIGITFLGGATLRWSYFPLVGLFTLGMALLVIAMCRPIREALKKKLFF